jgi:cell division protein ZipA
LAELRWILAGVGVVAIAAIWWWSSRRSGQAPGQAELRESSVVPLQSVAAAEVRDTPSEPRERPPIRDRSISPLEPLSIHTSDFEPVLDLPTVDIDLPHEVGSLEEEDYIESSLSELDADAEDAAGPVREDAPTAAEPAAWEPPLSAAAAPAQAPLDLPPAAERQKIVTLRVCAVGDGRWSGRDLTSALEGHGLAYGRYQVYHRKHVDGRSIFCVASLIEPGTFDAANMADEEFRGVSMFAVLPGPLEPLQAIDALLNTARELARDLSGTVQDGNGMPFSPQRIAALREDVARFARESTARGPAA